MKKLFAILLLSIAASACEKQDNSTQRSISGNQNAAQQYTSQARSDSPIQKFALVIGNGDYSNISKLKNPVNDANDMTSVLQNMGFTVDKVIDGGLEQMEKAIQGLKNRLSISENSYGFLFYAGHGVQSNAER